MIIAHPGDTVHTPPGQWHWHGAASDTAMSHLAVSASPPSTDAPAVTWGTHVTDDEYAFAVTAPAG